MVNLKIALVIVASAVCCSTSPCKAAEQFKPKTGDFGLPSVQFGPHSRRFYRKRPSNPTPDVIVPQTGDFFPDGTWGPANMYNRPWDGDVKTVEPPPIDDPDCSEDLLMPWCRWDGTLDGELTRLFARLIQKSFPMKKLTCYVSYVVSDERKISNIHVSIPSSDPFFSAMVIVALKMLSDDPNLTFPSGSRRKLVKRWDLFEKREGGLCYVTGESKSWSKDRLLEPLK